MADGPFTDAMVRDYVMACKTQAGIIKYAEAMAQFLAEAGRASEKATGDSATFAIDRWCEVIRKRAKELVKDEPCSHPRAERRKKLISSLRKLTPT